MMMMMGMSTTISRMSLSCQVSHSALQFTCTQLPVQALQAQAARA